MFTTMMYKSSEKSSVVQVPQEMPPACNEGCVVSAAGCRCVLEEFRCYMEADAIAHIPISTLLFLHSHCLELAKKHLFDFRYLLLHGRTFPRMITPVPLGSKRGYVDGASYPSYSVSKIYSHVWTFKSREVRKSQMAARSILSSIRPV